MRKIRILVVDDEPLVLQVVAGVIQATIQSEVVTAPCALKALDLMRKMPFDVVVSDLAMPEMDGKQFLEVVKELYPETVRLIFTGSRGAEPGLHTAGVAHQFFLKPAAMMTISERIQRVLAVRELLPRTCSLEQIVAQIRMLPTIPAVYQELERELGNPDVSTERIGKIVEQDIAISAKVLQLVNSAFFGLRERVSSPAQASSLLGLKVLQALVLTTHIFSEWKDRTLPGFSIQGLWDHSLGTATIVQEIALAEQLDAALRDDLYVAALFHDIGKLVIAANLPDSYVRINEMCQRDRISTAEAETRIMGVSHAEVGAYLLAVWGFADAVVNSCAHHHHPERKVAEGDSETGGALDSVAVVHVADVLQHESRGETSTLYSRLNTEYVRKCGLAGRVAKWRRAVVRG
ncbi:MAG: hypothetical protein A3K19_01620 [Lentisphaerae bacterium RIFOXYB12_FULL_65_16]|nr:MAG: hypothetical protein A3K18_02845 [Lentisphaerae bacterium RIFOXYA12_64_32]OGV92849.1 MAG: hypothetical protein A3K19_01620 [Lentisphaerae bacterium RIFOXYB12_FULL_65_16]